MSAACLVSWLSECCDACFDRFLCVYRALFDFFRYSSEVIVIVVFYVDTCVVCCRFCLFVLFVAFVYVAF